MIWLGTWLAVVGLCDLLRATRDVITDRHRWALVALGLALLVVGGLALGLPGAGWPTVAVLGAAGLVGWLLGSSYALEEDRAHRGRWRAVGFAALLGPALALLLLADGVRSHARLPAVAEGSLLDRLGPDLAVLVAGVLLVQLSTANVAVRMLLDAVGVPAVTNEKRLKGGRVLGPMERLFVVFLGLAGSLGAAAVVVAAKGLLRYPELQRTQREEGPTDVSEYFLIGSFASWLAAIAGLGVLVLGGSALR